MSVIRSRASGLPHTTSLQQADHSLMQQPQRETCSSPVKLQRRHFQFATPEYAACFHNLPTVDTQTLRQNAVDYLSQQFDPQTWYSDPVSP
jgi:hypothetical protein